MWHVRMFFFFFQAEDGIRDVAVTGVQTCALPISKALDVSLTTVSTWSRRFELQGLDGLKDRPGRGRKAWLATEKVRQVITRVTRPPPGRKKWSTRSMAAAVGLSHQSVHRIWKSNDLKPHLVRTFKISND